MTRCGVDHGVSILVALVVLLAVVFSPPRQALGQSGGVRVKAPRRESVSNPIRRESETHVGHASHVDQLSSFGLKGELEALTEAEPTAASLSASPRCEAVAALRPRAIPPASYPSAAAAGRPLRC